MAVACLKRGVVSIRDRKSAFKDVSMDVGEVREGR